MITRSSALMASAMAVALSSVSTLVLAQDAAPFDLGTLVLRGDKVSRTADEVAPGISIIPERLVESPATNTIAQVVKGQANVLADEDGTIPTIRGISSTVNTNQVFGSGIVPRVPILVDNVASPAAQSTGYLSSSAWDVSAVEVARGPQPTSTGRNAFSGAIRVFTNDPVFEPEYALRFGASSLRNVTTTAFMINQPLVEDQLAFRLAGEFRQGETLSRVNDPLVTAFDPNELDYRNLRAKLLYTPASLPGLELKFTYDRKTSRDHYAPVIEAGNRPDQLFINNFVGFGGYDVTKKENFILDGSYDFSDTTKLFFRASRSDNILENPFTGTSLSAAAGFRDFGSLSFNNDETEFEAYLQFSDIGSIDKGVIGIVHNQSDEIVDNDPSGLANAFLIDVDGSAKTTAIYGEVEWDLGAVAGVEGLTLITGGRYEKDTRTRRVFADTNLQASRTFKEEVFLPKLGLRFNPSDTLELGYTFSKAYRPGGVEVDLVSGFLFPIGAPGALPVSPFERETIKNHEFHVKASFYDDRLTLGGTLFYYEYKNAQVAGASAVASAFPGFFLTGNVPEAKGKGIELTADYQGPSGFGFNASLGWLKTEITNAGPIAAAFQGFELPNAPEFTGSLGVTYEHSSGWDAGANLRYVGEMTNTLGGPTLDDYVVVDFAAGYDFRAFKNTDMRIDLVINNLTDKGYIVENVGPRTIAGRPREVVVNLTARF